MDDWKSITKQWNRALPSMARALLKVEADEVQMEKLLRERFPVLYAHLRGLRRQSRLLSLWGLSSNIDENTKTEIISPSILSMLGSLTGVDLSGPCHAGVQHTYGYLFSLIETPYGMKRDRWTQFDLELGFGLPRPVLSPVPDQGTLLFNVTYLLGRIAFRGQRRQIALLREHRELVDESLVAYPFQTLKRERLVETFPVAGRGHVRLISDVVKFPEAAKYDQLLIYSLDDQEHGQRLITTFPIQQSALDELKQRPTGNDVEVQLKYNAVLPGTNGPQIGSREWIR